MIRIFCWIFFLVVLTAASGQSPKPPEAFPDYAETYTGVSVEVKVLENDWGEEGHELKVIYAAGSQYAMAITTDTSVIYVQFMSYLTSHIDTIHYRIRDENNGLLSELTPIYIELSDMDYFKEITSLEIGNYSLNFHCTGNHFWEYYPSNMAMNNIPRDQQTFTMRDSHLILCGKNSQSNNLLAWQHGMYLSSYMSDYIPGPVMNLSGDIINTYDAWLRQWKITRQEINHHVQHNSEPGYVIPETILYWPGNGDTTLGQAHRLAPFIDGNGNGVYEPGLGDYPAIRGDKAVLMIYNDHVNNEILSNTEKLGVEVYQMVYGFDCDEDSAFYNTFFVHYTIINRSEYSLEDLYFGIMTDFMIGNPTDNYVGCDTLLNCYFMYNDSIDEQYSYYPVFGEAPPAQGIVFLNQPLSSFISYGAPVLPPNKYLLQGLWSYDLPLTYGGNGHFGSEITKYLYPGDPSDPEQWSHMQSNPLTSDYGGSVGGSGPYFLPADDTIELDLAYVFARDYNGTNLSGVELMKERIERIRWFYDNDSTPCGSTWSGSSKYSAPGHRFFIVPNPAERTIRIVFDKDLKGGRYEIIGLDGKRLLNGVIDEYGIVNISDLNSGLYIIRIHNFGKVLSGRFVKK